MSGSAAQAPRTLFREPLCIRRTIIPSLAFDLDQWQMLNVRGVAVYGRPTLEDCNTISIETANKILLAHYDEIEALGPVDT